LCCDIDKPAFDSIVSKTLCNELILEYNSLYSTLPNGVTESELSARKSLIVGKGKFFVFCNHPDDRHPVELRAAVQESFDIMASNAGDLPFENASIYHCKPAIGRIPCIQEIFIDLTISTAQYSFIEEVSLPSPKLDYQTWPDRFQVDCDVNSHSNKFEFFQQVTLAINDSCNWKFSYSKASSFITEIESDKLDINNLEPW
jgi:hypothetical protein